MVDIVEVCGGENRVTQFLIRRLHRTGFRRGLNLDSVVGVNLLLASERKWVWTYLETCKPIVVVMSPPCRGMRGYVELNRITNPETAAQSYYESAIIGDFCADIATSKIAVADFTLTNTPSAPCCMIDRNGSNSHLALPLASQSFNSAS